MKIRKHSFLLSPQETRILTPPQSFWWPVAEAGADLIEVGIPFSDPTAEGPVIQEADERALAAGCTTDKLFAMLSQVRPKLDIPVVFMTYMNPVFTYGKERFLQKCVEVGMDGIIIPDLPYEEKDEMSSLCDTYGVDLISLVPPPPMSASA